MSYLRGFYVLQYCRTALTHFLSIPLVSSENSAKFKELKAAILSEPGSEAANIDDSIFVDDRSLHLTLAVMKLYSPEKREKARQVLSYPLFPRDRFDSCIAIGLLGGRSSVHIFLILIIKVEES